MDLDFSQAASMIMDFQPALDSHLSADRTSPSSRPNQPSSSAARRRGRAMWMESIRICHNIPKPSSERSRALVSHLHAASSDPLSELTGSSSGVGVKGAAGREKLQQQLAQGHLQTAKLGFLELSKILTLIAKWGTVDCRMPMRPEFQGQAVTCLQGHCSPDL